MDAIWYAGAAMELAMQQKGTLKCLFLNSRGRAWIDLYINARKQQAEEGEKGEKSDVVLVGSSSMA